MNHAYLLRFAAAGAILFCGAPAQSAPTPISDRVFQLLHNRMEEISTKWYVFKDHDSGFNQDFASGLFAFPPELVQSTSIDSACVYDPAIQDCTTNNNAVDQDHGTAFRITFPAMQPGQFSGLNFEDPEQHGVNHSGKGLNLSGAKRILLRAASPGGNMQVKFLVRGSESAWLQLTPAFQDITLDLIKDLNPPARKLVGVHTIFTVFTDGVHAPPMGGTVLLDDVQLDPAPDAQKQVLGFPLANDTFGIIPIRDDLPTDLSFPPDQVNANLTSIYESSLALLGLLNRHRDDQDLIDAKKIADAYVYALDHPNHGLLLPSSPYNRHASAPDDPTGPAVLHNGYMSGNLWLSANQPSGGRKDEARLAGFTGPESRCGPGHFCLVLDGATGGNNAFAILALVAASRQFRLGNDVDPYLRAARRIAQWIIDNLQDAASPGFQGYWVGWDDGASSRFLSGKSIENNADVCAAMQVLADRERELQLSDSETRASNWETASRYAGDFVMSMYNPKEGHFYGGTLPLDQPRMPGLNPDGERRGNEVINTFDFIDSQTFVALAMAGLDLYRDRIDWRKPVEWFKGRQSQMVNFDGHTFSGFNLVHPDDGDIQRKGIAWEFTGQAVVTMRFVDSLRSDPPHFQQDVANYLNQILDAQRLTRFGDREHLGIVASTVDKGDALPPNQQCLKTPFQCIAERVGLAASLWGSFAETGFNPLGRPPLKPAH